MQSAALAIAALRVVAQDVAVVPEFLNDGCGIQA